MRHKKVWLILILNLLLLGSALGSDRPTQTF